MTKTVATSEVEVVHSLKNWLLTRGMNQQAIGSLVVDSDRAYRHSRFRAALEPMGSLRINGYRPDIVCNLEKTPTAFILGFEVKPSLGDWPKGLAQARNYRSGVHQAYLAIPRDRTTSTRELETAAAEFGVGVLLRDSGGWQDIVPAPDPRPSPATVQTIERLLEGVPLARRLQLNHPLNYLVVPFLRAEHPNQSIESSLAAYWTDLGSSGTRKHAIAGAESLGLIDRDGNITVDGTIIVDLLRTMGFCVMERPNKRTRLCEVSSHIAVVARVSLLRQPSVRLVIESLQQERNNRATISGLLATARRRDRLLADALFLSDPDLENISDLRPADFNPSTVFKFKQVLWHAGILASKADSSAGTKAADYVPDRDIWELDRTIISSVKLDE